MSDFVIHANLPHNTKSLAVGIGYKELLDKALKSLDVQPVYCPANPYIDKNLSSHVDLSLLHAGGDTVFLAPSLAHTVFSYSLEEAGFRTVFPQAKMAETYPKDSLFNLCVLKKHFFYSPKVSEKSIVDFLTAKKLVPVSVKQGYCRCSVCVVNDHSIITSDSGICSAAAKSGMDCLLISSGYVSLPGFEYGFIGGASFKLSDEILCFTGRLDGHPDKLKILDFLSFNKVKPVFLTDEPLFDIGSAVPLTEK